MPRAKLTESYIKSTPVPRGSLYELHWDTEVKGLTVRITKGGSRHFVLAYTFDGKNKQFTIGSWMPPPSNRLGGPATREFVGTLEWDGDWSVARGAYFADCLDEDRVATNLWPEIPRGWWTWLAHDFGSAAPSVTYVLAASPGGEGPDGRFYPRGSIVAVHELATNRSDDRLNEGIGWTVPVLSDAIKEMCERWKIDPEGVADDACFARSGHSVGSIADEFERAGVHFVPAQKGDRVQGW